jgi:hypothetical protein
MHVWGILKEVRIWGTPTEAVASGEDVYQRFFTDQIENGLNDCKGDPWVAQ